MRVCLRSSPSSDIAVRVCVCAFHWLPCYLQIHQLLQSWVKRCSPLYDGIQKLLDEFIILFSADSLVTQSNVHRVTQQLLQQQSTTSLNSRLDYCNALLYRALASTIIRLITSHFTHWHITATDRLLQGVSQIMIIKFPEFPVDTLSTYFNTIYKVVAIFPVKYL